MIHADFNEYMKNQNAATQGKIIKFFPVMLIGILMFGKTGLPSTSIEGRLVNRDIINKVFCELQMSAVTIDMFLYIGWLRNEKEPMKKAARLAIKRLGEIEKALMENRTTIKEDETDSLLSQTAECFKNLYGDIQEKEIPFIESGAEMCQEKHLAYQKAVAAVLPLLKVQEEFLPQPVFEDSKQKEVYTKAAALIRQDRPAEAISLLEGIKERMNAHSAAHDYVLMLINNAAGRAEPMEGFEEKLIGYPKTIMKKDYSPLFLDAFIAWRTHVQSFDYGVSNLSEIPNWNYNLQRKRLLDKIGIYLKKHPVDRWAMRQLSELLLLPNIERGGTSGNSNLNHMEKGGL